MRNVISREDLIGRGQAKAQHAARPPILQALSQEDGAFCRAMCTFSKPSVVKFRKLPRQTMKKIPLQRHEWTPNLTGD